MRMTLGQIAEFVDGEAIGNLELPIEDVAPFDLAGRRDLTFSEKGRMLKDLNQTQAAAVLVPRGTYDADKPLIIVSNPRLAFAKILAIFHPGFKPEAGIHPTAVIGKECKIGKDVVISAGVVIGDRVVLGDRVTLHPNVVIGNEVRIGEETVVHPQVAILERCCIGQRVIIHAGTIIGSDGYGFVQDDGRHVKIPQTGIVQIDSDVEIGANNTIDRATFGKTWIKQGVKTDNQVHIAHNVVVGEHSLLVAQVGIAGSTTIGHHVVIAGQSGISDHIEIGNEVLVGGRTGVATSVPDKQIVSGSILAMPHKSWLRMNRILVKLPELYKKLRQLEERLQQLKNARNKP
jgi:UDP-3-O-[3-hydroxymyristoyl] glucosamine N-acyltransferase